MSTLPNVDTHPRSGRHARTAPLSVKPGPTDNLREMVVNRSIPGVILCQRDGTLVGLNEVAQKILTYARSGAVGEPGFWQSLSERIKLLSRRSSDGRAHKLPGLVFQLGQRWYLGRPLGLRMVNGHERFAVVILERVSATRLYRVRHLCEQYRLTRREIDVVKALIQGYGDKEIGQRLGLSYHSVRQYLKTIRLRLGVHSRAALLARLYPQ